MSARPRLLLAALLTASGGLLSSCTYEPYAYGPSPRTSVSTSVGYSSGGHVSSSVFIRTTNSRWGYDPHCRSYYDFTTRCYYDPWLRGYYPRGYRPPVIIGAPHPRGWRPGMKHCPPPVHVRSHRIADYHKRDYHYRKLNHSWAKHVRRGASKHQHRDQRSGYGQHSRSGQTSHSNRRPTSSTTRNNSRTPTAGWNRSSHPHQRLDSQHRSRAQSSSFPGRSLGNSSAWQNRGQSNTTRVHSRRPSTPHATTSPPGRQLTTRPPARSANTTNRGTGSTRIGNPGNSGRSQASIPRTRPSPPSAPSPRPTRIRQQQLSPKQSAAVRSRVEAMRQAASRAQAGGQRGQSRQGLRR